VCLWTCICTHAKVRVRMCLRIETHTSSHVQIIFMEYEYIYTYIYIYIHTYIHIYIHTYNIYIQALNLKTGHTPEVTTNPILIF
jgi:hypothetical protein